METNGKLPILTILVGLQCSGKSTWANAHQNNGCVVISSDAIRKELPEYSNEKIFKEVYRRINSILKQGKNCILDATNTTIKSRKRIFDNIKEPCNKVALIFNTPYEECLNRLEVRNSDPNSHSVPKEVLKKYLYSFEIPFTEEGFDYIDIVNKPSMEDSLIYQKEAMLLAVAFDQHNMHHTQNLFNHMNSVREEISKQVEKDPILTLSGMYHDIGKLFTQTYKPGDLNAHYYNHANVGTYYLLCRCGFYADEQGDSRYLVEETLRWLFYINYHMHLYNCKTDKSQNKWRNIFGNYKYNNLIILNKADMGGK